MTSNEEAKSEGTKGTALWVHVHQDGQFVGKPVKIKPVPDDVDDLCEAVKKKITPVLDAVGVHLLQVYEHGTTKFDTPLKPDHSDFSAITAKKPLIVVAPNPKPPAADSDLLRQLKPFLMDWQRKRKREMVPWGRESLKTKVRSSSFQARLRVFYDRDAGNGEIYCQVLNKAYPSEHVIGSHIWKHETKGEGLRHFGIPEGFVDHERNGLLLCKGLEEAFDNMKVCFLYNILQKCLILHVADKTLLNELVFPSTSVTFGNVDGSRLRCPEHNLPYRRLLSWHACNTLELYGQLASLRFSGYHRLSEDEDGFKFPNDLLTGMMEAGAEVSDEEEKEEEERKEEEGEIEAGE